MQLVLSKNRIIAHGENFLAMGGVVINTETGAKYENATIAECEGGCPSDIDQIGYEYHAGQFVPCAPYGVGSGNVAVVCNKDCKALKDSGIPLSRFAVSEKRTYQGIDADEVSLTFEGVPDVVFIQPTGIAVNSYFALILGNVCYEFHPCKTIPEGGYTATEIYSNISVERTGNTITVYLPRFNNSNLFYEVYALTARGE